MRIKQHPISDPKVREKRTRPPGPPVRSTGAKHNYPTVTACIDIATVIPPQDTTCSTIYTRAYTTGQTKPRDSTSCLISLPGSQGVQAIHSDTTLECPAQPRASQNAPSNLPNTAIANTHLHTYIHDQIPLFMISKKRRRN
jgi:hypothetical protein